MNDNPYAAPQTEIRTEVATEVTGKRPLATRWQRFAGNLIDSVVLVVGVLVLAGLVFGLIGYFNPELMFKYTELGETPTTWLVESVIALVSMSLFFLVVNGYLLSTRGQTLGKLAVKTQIVSDSDELVPCAKIFFVRYFLFWCINMIPVAGGFIILADSLMIFRNNHKCWHDDLTGTKVVMLRTPAHLRQLPDEIKVPDTF